jgi:hypothetical protein
MNQLTVTGGVACVFLVLTTVTSLCQAQLARNSYLDLWKNVFDELPKDAIDEAVSHVEDRVMSSEASQSSGKQNAQLFSSGSHLIDVLEKRRESRRYKGSKLFPTGLLQQDSSFRDESGLLFGGAGVKKGPRHHMTLRQLGLPVDDSKTVFEGSACFKLQNFGNNDGYMGILASSDGECSAKVALDARHMLYQEDNFFTIDCSLAGATANHSDSSSGLHQMMIKQEDATGIRAALYGPSENSTCTMTVTSQKSHGESHGAGSAIRIPVSDVPIATKSALNAIRITMCNVNQAASPPDVAVQSIKLNGKSLSSQTPFTVSQHDSCQSWTFRVPTVSLSDTFVINGDMRLTSRDSGTTFSPGDRSSVEISLGHV